MIQLKRQLNRLGAAVALLLLSLLAAGVMLVVTGDFANTRIAQQRQQEDLLNSLRDRLQNLQNERRIQREFGARYARYREQGVFIGNQRLGWVETIKRASQDLKLPGMHYSLSARQAHRSETISDSGGLGVYLTPISLKLGLLHEGDLLSLDTLLRESKLGLYDMKHCTLRMIRKVTFETVSEPNITAECTIDWISFIFNDPDLQAATGIPGMEAM